MTTKVNGHLQQDVWFEKDTCILKATSTLSPFSMPTGPNTEWEGTTFGTAEKVMNILQTRGTVIGYCVVDDSNAHYMFGHAAGFFANDPQLTAPPSPPGKTQPNVAQELAQLLADSLGGEWTIEVFNGFAGAQMAGEALRYKAGSPVSEENTSPFPIPGPDDTVGPNTSV